jgi:hypothetical protein
VAAATTQQYLGGAAALAGALRAMVLGDAPALTLALLQRVGGERRRLLHTRQRFEAQQLAPRAQALADGNLLHCAAMLLHGGAAGAGARLPPAVQLEVFTTLEACGVPHCAGGANDDFPFECAMQPLQLELDTPPPAAAAAAAAAAGQEQQEGVPPPAAAADGLVLSMAAHDEPSAIWLELAGRGPDFWLNGTLVRACQVAAGELKPNHLRALLARLDDGPAAPQPRPVRVQCVARAIEACELARERHESVREVVRAFNMTQRQRQGQGPGEGCGYAVESDAELRAFFRLLARWEPPTLAVRRALIEALEVRARCGACMGGA